MERSGIGQIFEQADNLDIACLRAGSIECIKTSYRPGHVSESDRLSLIEAVAVGDILCNFNSGSGEVIAHSVNERCISVGLDRLQGARTRALNSGGPEKVRVLQGCLRLIRPNVFITDERTVKSMIEQAGS